MCNKRFLRVVAFCLLFTGSVASAAVYERVLDNGLKLLVKEDHRAPIVFSSIWYKVGGSYEHNGITGISHVLEHMMFQGTQKYGPMVLEKMVANVGGMQNAGTAEDFTFYYQTLPAKKLALSFDLESDRMRHLSLTDKAFKKEIQVVMEERRMRYDDNPQRLLDERLQAAAFVNNPYHHSAIGWMNDLENMTVNDVRCWYNDWYHPNNAILVVVGDVSPDAVYALAKKYFAAIPARTLPVTKPRIEVKPLGKIRLDINLPAKLPYLRMGYFTTSLTDKENAKDAFALDVIASVLGGSDSSRLQSQLVRKQQLATSISSGYDPFSLHSGLFSIAATPAPWVSVADLEKAIEGQIARLQSVPVSKKELSRVKAQLIADKVYSSDSIQTQAMFLGIPEAVGLSWQQGEHYIDSIAAITPEDVKAAAIKYFQQNRLTLAILHPQE